MNTSDSVSQSSIVKPSNMIDWFVTVADGVEGPFNEDELIAFAAKNNVTPQALFWNKDLPEWTPLAGVNSKKILEALYGTPVEPKNVEAESIVFSPLSKIEFWLDQQPENRPSLINSTALLVDTPHKKTTKIKLAIGALTLLCGGLAGAMYLQNQNSFPQIPELSPEQIRDLKATQNENLKMGTVGAIQILAGSTSIPRFAITTNVKTPQSIVMRLEGVPGTLIGYVKYAAVNRYTIRDGLLLTNPILNQKGEMLPAGEYNISIVCESCPNKDSLNQSISLADKKFFIGGERNVDYDTKLRNYHFQLKTQAREELIYFKQLTDLLMNHYDDLRQIPSFDRQGAGTKRADLLNKWNQNHSQYNVEFLSISDKYKKGSFFYEKYVFNLMNLFNSIALLYETKIEKAQQDEFIKLGLVFRNNYEQLSEYRLKLENLPLTANGRPRTD